MADTENGREKQADDENRREDGVPDSLPECHRRGCTEMATFVVLERYQEEPGTVPLRQRPFSVKSMPTKRVPRILMAVTRITCFVSSLSKRRWTWTQHDQTDVVRSLLSC